MSKPKRATNIRRRFGATAFPLALKSGASTMALAPARVLVVFRARPSKAALTGILAQYKLVLDDGGDGQSPPPAGVTVTRAPQWFFLRTPNGAPIAPATVAALQSDNRFAMIAPVYHRNDVAGPRGFVGVLPGGFAVRLSVTAIPDLGRIFLALGLKIHEQRTKLLRPFTFLQTPDVVANAAHVLAPRLAEMLAGQAPQIVHEIVPLVSAMSAVDPSDSYYATVPAGDVEQVNHQWDMKRIRARDAWQNNVGIAGVRAYVIDEGIQQNHADFAVALAAGRVSQHNVDTGLGDPSGLAPNNNHGTQLAGIMAAGHDDAAPSTAGWAPGCTLVSLRGGTNASISPLSNAIIAAGINEAGASGSPSVVCLGVAAGDPNLFADNGMGGLVQTALGNNPDVVVCVAAGNWTVSADQAINYTSNGGAYFANVLICGATQQGTAVPSSPTTSTGDDVWKDFGGGANAGSRHGPEISVVAPGDALVTLNTPAGYTVGTSQGTSLAAAHVAGLALLVRSKEGASFNGAAVRHKIERTAAKADTWPYATSVAGAQNLTVGMWNDRMGFGRIDAAAVLVHDVDTDAADAGRTDVFVRGYPTDTGARPIPGGTDFWSSGDVVVSTNQNLLTVGPAAVGSAADLAFDAARAVVTSTQIPAPGGITAVPVYVFVRVGVTNAFVTTPAPARGVRVTAVICASATGFQYPIDWDGGGAANLHVVTTDDSPSTSYFTGPLAMGSVYIARLLIPTGSNFQSFSMNHGCCAVRVTATNDIQFSRAPNPSPGAQTQLNNIMQRNLSVV